MMPHRQHGSVENPGSHSSLQWKLAVYQNSGRLPDNFNRKHYNNGSKIPKGTYLWPFRVTSYYRESHKQGREHFWVREDQKKERVNGDILFSHMFCITSHLALVYSQHSLFYQLLCHADFLAKGKGAFLQKKVNDRFMHLVFYDYILVKSETKPHHLIVLKWLSDLGRSQTGLTTWYGLLAMGCGQ